MFESEFQIGNSGFTHSVVLRNSGRRPATNVRLAHPYLPDFNVFPSVGYRVENLPGGGREIVMPTLVPNEQVTISYLYFPPPLACSLTPIHAPTPSCPVSLVVWRPVDRLPCSCQDGQKGNPGS